MVNKASRELKNILGPMAYIFSGARQLVDQQPFKATLRIDGEEYRLEASAITVANAAPDRFAAIVPICGTAKIDFKK